MVPIWASIASAVPRVLKQLIAVVRSWPNLGNRVEYLRPGNVRTYSRVSVRISQRIYRLLCRACFASGRSAYDQSTHFVISRVGPPHRYSETCHEVTHGSFRKDNFFILCMEFMLKVLFYAFKRARPKGTRPETRVVNQNTEGKHKQSSKAVRRSFVSCLAIDMRCGLSKSLY